MEVVRVPSAADFQGGMSCLEQISGTSLALVAMLWLNP